VVPLSEPPDTIWGPDIEATSIGRCFVVGSCLHLSFFMGWTRCFRERQKNGGGTLAGGKNTLFSSGREEISPKKPSDIDGVLRIPGLGEPIEGGETPRASDGFRLIGEDPRLVFSVAVTLAILEVALLFQLGHLKFPPLALLDSHALKRGGGIGGFLTTRQDPYL